MRAGYRDSDKYRYYELSGIEVSSPSGAPTDISIEDFGADRRDADRQPLPDGPGRPAYIVRYRLAHLVNDIGDGTAEFYYNVVEHRERLPQQDVRAAVAGPPRDEGGLLLGPYGSTQLLPRHARGHRDLRRPRPRRRARAPRSSPPSRATPSATSPPTCAQGDVGELRRARRWSPATARTLGLARYRTAACSCPLSAAGLMGLLVWNRGRDEQYAGPDAGALARARPGGSRWSRAARRRPSPCSSPRPPGSSPVIVGTVIDEEANVVDVTATIVDLAVRGYLRYREEAGRTSVRADWVLTRTSPPAAAAPLSPYEQLLLDALFAGPAPA